MSGYQFILATSAIVERAIGLIRVVPRNSRVTIKGPKRTLPQNDRMWAMLTDFAAQTDHFGAKMPPPAWKEVLLDALGHEGRAVPSLDGSRLIRIGNSSSELSVQQMSDFLEFIAAVGAQRGVVFHAPEYRSAA
jgi:NinB protein